MFGPFHDSQKEVPMRSVVAAFLAPFLVATPLTQVLAQTGHQGPRVVQTDNFRVTIPVPTHTFQTSERPLLLSWVSVERNSPATLLWAAGAIDSTAASEPLLYAAPAGLSRGAKVGGVIGALILIVVIFCTIGCVSE